MIYDLELTSEIKSSEVGLSLIDYLSARFTYQTKEIWIQRNRSSLVLVNGISLPDDHILSLGDKVTFVVKNFHEPDLDCSYKVEYEDENIIAVSKPSDLPVQSTRRIYRQTLTYLLRKNLNLPKLNPINRIDRETGGLVLYLKKSYTSGLLSKFPLKILKNKFYIAILRGCLPEKVVEVNIPLAEEKGGAVGYKMAVNMDNGFPSRTVFYRLLENNGETLALVHIFTGRKHQIRAHASAIGCPVIGDKLYYKDSKYFLMRCRDEKLSNEDMMDLGAKHHLLHAYTYELQLPDKNILIKSTQFSAEMKKHLELFGIDWEQDADILIKRISNCE